MIYVTLSLGALVIVLGLLLRWYILRVEEQKKEITAYKRKMASVDKKHKQLNEKLKKLARIEAERREKNAEIDHADDSDVDDILNGLMSNDG